MSVLKKAFEKACLHLRDWEHDLKFILPIKDIRDIVQSYTCNELLFENDLHAIAYHEAGSRNILMRMRRLFYNTKDERVRKWFYFFLQINSEVCGPITELQVLNIISHSFFFLGHTLCNRTWCWKRYLNIIDADACICGDPLDRGKIVELSHEFFSSSTT